MSSDAKADASATVDAWVKGLSEEKDMLSTLKEIRGRTDIFQSTNYGTYLSQLFPLLQGVLETRTTPQFQANDINTCRQLVMEILNRLPNSQPLRGRVVELVRVCIKVLGEDNEENALIALRIIFDQHKTHRPPNVESLESQVPAFLEIVTNIYKNPGASLAVIFDGGVAETTASQGDGTAMVIEGSSSSSSGSGGEAASSTPSVSSEQGNDTPVITKTEKPFLRGTGSFKILSECPLIVMLLFQLYPKFIKSNIPVMMPLMMEALSLKAPPGAQQKSRSRFREFIAAQVKTLSFLTYLLRGYADLMRQYEGPIAQNVVHLLSVCPSEAVSSRKELLVATRHILSTDFRRGFIGQAERLLDDQLLLGTGKEAYNTLRPLAYSTFADLVYQVRESLTLNQLSRLVHLFGWIINDSILPSSVHKTAVMLFLNIVERIAVVGGQGETDFVRSRELVLEILRSMVRKFRNCITHVVKVKKQNEINERMAKAVDSDPGKMRSEIDDIISAYSSIGASDDGDVGGTMDVEGDAGTTIAASFFVTDKFEPMQYIQACSAGTAPSTRDPGSLASDTLRNCSKITDQVRDVKQLLKTMLWGLKNIVTNLSKLNLKISATSNSSKINYDELHLFQNLFTWGLQCSRIFVADKVNEKHDENGKEQRDAGSRSNSSNGSSSSSSSKTPSPSPDVEVKEYLEYFAAIYTVVDPDLIRLIIGQNIDELCEYCVGNAVYLTVLQQLLHNGRVTMCTVDILITYMIKRMPELANPITNMQQPTTTATAVGKDNQSQNTMPISQEAMKQGQKSTILLRIFKMTLNSITVFQDNEKILRPRLQTIIQHSLRLAHSGRVSVNYYFVLRTLFRSISSGKFEYSFKEVVPILPMLLEGLSGQLRRTDHDTVKNIILELCLTVPARLKMLLPHFSLLLDHLATALCAKGELPNLALRTLEFWIETESQHLHDILHKHVDLQRKLMMGICKHLKPAPYPYGILALRILGKLGGRNRLFLRDFFHKQDLSEFARSKIQTSCSPLYLQKSWRVLDK